MPDVPWVGNEEADYSDLWDYGPAFGWDAYSSAPGWDDQAAVHFFLSLARANLMGALGKFYSELSSVTFGEGALDLTTGSTQFNALFRNAARDKLPFDPTPAIKVVIAVVVAAGRDQPRTGVSHAVAYRLLRHNRHHWGDAGASTLQHGRPAPDPRRSTRAVHRCCASARRRQHRRLARAIHPRCPQQRAHCHRWRSGARRVRWWRRGGGLLESLETAPRPRLRQGWWWQGARQGLHRQQQGFLRHCDIFRPRPVCRCGVVARRPVGLAPRRDQRPARDTTPARVTRACGDRRTATPVAGTRGSGDNARATIGRCGRNAPARRRPHATAAERQPAGARSLACGCRPAPGRDGGCHDAAGTPSGGR
jgi:hypothetical protein